jgi:hypothetical protein
VIKIFSFLCFKDKLIEKKIIKKYNRKEAVLTLVFKKIGHYGLLVRQKFHALWRF